MDDADIGEAVVLMNFTARPESQWEFILAAVAFAESDDELAHIAAGPVEHLLGWHRSFIERVEWEAKSNHKFGRMMLGVQQYRMTDDTWARVVSLQAAATARGDVLDA